MFANYRTDARWRRRFSPPSRLRPWLLLAWVCLLFLALPCSESARFSCNRLPSLSRLPVSCFSRIVAYWPFVFCYSPLLLYQWRSVSCRSPVPFGCQALRSFQRVVMLILDSATRTAEIKWAFCFPACIHRPNCVPAFCYVTMPTTIHTAASRTRKLYMRKRVKIERDTAFDR
jgi:hypothetical protein